MSRALYKIQDPVGWPISCVHCLNTTATRGGATHVAEVGGRSYGLCDDHLDAPLPPTHNNTRKAT